MEELKIFPFQEDTCDLQWNTKSGHRVMVQPWHCAKMHAVPNGKCYSRHFALFLESEWQSSGYIVIRIVDDTRIDMYAHLHGCQPKMIGGDDDKEKGIIVLDDLFTDIGARPASGDAVEKLKKEMLEYVRIAIDVLPVLTECGRHITYPRDAIEKERHRILKKEFVPAALERLQLTAESGTIPYA